MNNMEKTVNSLDRGCYSKAWGSIFTERARESDTDVASAAGRRPRIVIIDDSRASLTLYERGLAALDVMWSGFESPRLGFDHLQENGADLVFLGNLMRETDGLTLLRKMRLLNHHADTAVVVMSTKDYDQDRTMAKKLGALDYLIKPVRSQAIRELVEKYTGAPLRAS
jgi:PleD family two-component response regulator